MKTKAISSIFLLFTISISMISIAPNAFSDHHEITITPISGSGSDSGCELTEEGCYSPNPVTVYVGSVIIFSNTESVSHTFSSGVPSDDVIGVEFNSGMLEPGSSFQWIPENVGEFPYFDMIHPWMQGTIIVQEATEKTHEKMETHSEVAEETVVEEQVVEETVVEEQVVEETVVATQESEEKGGGCLIATATYGTELAPQVQLLREIRDNSLLQTESGSAFMGTFNDIYYTFSPTIADYERESPIFKEAVKFAITPMITTLSIMENANSESEVLGIGISLIALNLGMYVGIPAVVIIGIRAKF